MFRCNSCNEVFDRNGYCPKCGALLQNVNDASSMNNNDMTQNGNLNNAGINNGSNNVNFTNNNASMNQNLVSDEKQFNSVTKKDDKKYAILSIVIGVGGILFYLFIGLSVWVALVLCSIGLGLSQKSKQSAPGLSKAGFIFNILLGVMAIIMWILLIIESLV